MSALKFPVSIKISALCDDMVSTHHSYIRIQGPALLQEAAGISLGLTLESSHFHQIFVHLFCLLDHLLSQMLKEEKRLFPCFKRFERTQALFDTGSGSMAHLIESVHREQDKCKEELALLKTLLSETPISTPQYQHWLKRVTIFCDDIEEYLSKKNELLFPQVLACEQDLKKHSK